MNATLQYGHDAQNEMHSPTLQSIAIFKHRIMQLSTLVPLHIITKYFLLYLAVLNYTRINDEELTALDTLSRLVG